MYEGFIGNTILQDDYRYETGAILYAQQAKGLVDVKIFTEIFASMGDWVGYHLSWGPFRSTPTWYIICCFLMKVTHFKYIIRLFCIAFSSFTIIFIYKLANLIYDDFVATRTAYLWCYLPYPVIFSCFPYKDHMILFLTFTILYLSVRINKIGGLTKKGYIGYVILFLLLFTLRSGLTVALLFISLFIAFSDYITRYISFKRLVAFVIAISIAVILFYKSFGTILFKAAHYSDLRNSVSTQSAFQLAIINGPIDIWKIPITYLFAVISPINLSAEKNSWFAIVELLNLIMTPIAVSSVMCVFMPKTDKKIYWSLMAYYLLSAGISTGVFRHYYSLLPLPIMFAVAGREKMNTRELGIYLILSFTCSLLLIVYFGFLR